MKDSCSCIPCLVLPPNSFNESSYKKYENDLYNIFIDDFVNHEVIFLGKKVYIDLNKMYNGKSDTFFHVICGDKKTYPIFDRMERIHFPRRIIENYTQCDSCESSCKIKMFKKLIKNRIRYHLFSEENKYMVVLEDEGKRMKLVTSFYVDQPYKIHNYNQDYENYLKQKNKDSAVN